MSDSGSANSNSWTILTQEETAALTHRPVLHGTEHHGDSDTSPAEHTGRVVEGGVSVAHGRSVEAQQAPNAAERHEGDTSSATPIHVSTFSPFSASEAPPPPSVTEGHLLPDSRALSQSEGLPEGPDPDSFSDSSSHVSLAPEGHPALPLTTETLGRAELAQEEEGLMHEGPQRHLSGEGFESEGEESELTPRVSDIGKQAESLVESADGVKDSGAEPELRRRALLATPERVGWREEDEETEEEFQLHRREEEGGLSLNKCILGAVILLGLGTVFFSESDYGARDPRDIETPVKQVHVDSTELLNKLAEGNQQISVLQALLQAQEEELQLAKVRATEGAAERLRTEEVEKENGRLKKEMASLPVLLKENEKMKRELESVQALQTELDRLRATVTGLKLSTVDEAALPPVTSTVSPPSGQTEDSMQAAASEPITKKASEWEKTEEKKKKEEKKEWKKERKDGNKVELKREHKEGKEGDKRKEEWKNGKDNERKGWKLSGEKEKMGRGDEGKPWKDREGNKDGKEKNERKEWKEEKLNEGKEWRGKDGQKEKQDEGKEWRLKDGKKQKQDEGKEWRGKDGMREKKDEEWRGKDGKKQDEGKEWRGKDGMREKKDEEWRGKDGKKQDEGKEWRGKDGMREKKDEEWRGKDGKKQDEGKEWRGKDGKRETHRQNEDEEWGGREEKRERQGDRDKEERRKRDGGKDSGKESRHWHQKGETEWKEGGWREEGKPRGKKERKEDRKDRGEWIKDSRHSHEHHRHHGERLWQGPAPGKPQVGQGDYWPRQRARLQRNPGPPRPCDSPESCARAEGLRPVPRAQFQAVLDRYLTTATEAGADPTFARQLGNLAVHFFDDNGVFVHDQMSFLEFADDLEDILEDMAEDLGETSDEQDVLEEEMDGFEKEVTERFSMLGTGGEQEEREEESGRARG